MSVAVFFYDMSDLTQSEDQFDWILEALGGANELGNASLALTQGGTRIALPLKRALDRFASEKAFSLEFWSEGSRICGSFNKGVNYLFVWLKTATLQSLSASIEPHGVPRMAYGYMFDTAVEDFENHLDTFGLGMTQVLPGALFPFDGSSDAWGRELFYGTRAYRRGKFRDIYPVNIVGDLHIRGWGEGGQLGLKQLCDEQPETYGKLVELTNGQSIWCVREEMRIAVARNAFLWGKVVV